MTRIATRCLFFLILFGCQPEPDTQSQRQRLVLFAGQSNVVGVARLKDLDFHQTIQDPSVPFWYLGPGYEGPGEFVSLRIRPNGGFGPELTFPEHYSNAVIVKHGVSSSKMDRWLPEGNIWPSLENLMADALAATDAEPAALVWVHGESDAEDRVSAEAYGDKLELFIESVRGLLGDIPVVLNLLHADCQKPFVEKVRRGQQSVSGVQTISVDDLPLKKDSIHWTTETTLEAGRRFGRSLSDLDQ